MNKYKLYAILMTVAFCLFILPKIWYVISYQKTVGIVDHYTASVTRETKSYIPIAKFYVAKDSFYTRASKWEDEELKQGSKTTVIYNKTEPSKSYIYTFMGFWMTELMYFIVCFLAFSAVLLSKGLLPTHLTLDRKK